MPEQNDQPPKEKKGLKDHAETAKSVKDFFSKDDEENVKHCPKCYGNQKSEKYSKLATAFSLGAFAVAAVSLGMQIVTEPESAVKFNNEEWNQFLTELQKIAPASSSSSTSSRAAYVPPVSSSKPKPPATSSVAQASSAKPADAGSADAGGAAPAAPADGARAPAGTP